MTKEEKSEWRRWCYFCCRRMREFIFLGAWATLAWTLNVYIVRPFPVSGPPQYMLFAFEILFDLSTLVEMILLLFCPYKAHTSRWWNKRHGG